MPFQGVVLTEVLLGLKTEDQAASIADLMTAFTPVTELSGQGHEHAARLYRLCHSREFTVRSTIDRLIAQMCLRDGLPLLTKDRDFTSIAASAPLKLVRVSQQ